MAKGKERDSDGAGVQSGLSEKEKFDAEDTLTGHPLNDETAKQGPHKLETAEGPFKFK